AVRPEAFQRIADAMARPFLFPGRAAEGFGGPVPDRRIGQEFLELLLGLALEIAPVQIVFAHMVLAEPEVILEVARTFRRAILARLIAALLVAAPGRGFARARHATPTLGAALLVFCG